MTTPAMQDQLSKITAFADHAVRCMVVKITAVDYTNGDCSIDALDGGGAIADIPFYGSDPIVGDYCLALTFDGVLAVVGNVDMTVATKSRTITTVADPVTASSGWSIANSYLDYNQYNGSLYINVTRTGATIAGSTGGDITNTPVCQMKAGLPFPATQVGMASIGGNRQVGAVLNSAGLVTLTFLGPSVTFNTGYTFNASASFIRGS